MSRCPSRNALPRHHVSVVVWLIHAAVPLTQHMRILTIISTTKLVQLLQLLKLNTQIPQTPRRSPQTITRRAQDLRGHEVESHNHPGGNFFLGLLDGLVLAHLLVKTVAVDPCLVRAAEFDQVFVWVELVVDVVAGEADEGGDEAHCHRCGDCHEEAVCEEEPCPVDPPLDGLLRGHA
ncbi:hypothetical protein F5X68DRAFT_214535, partial [Plectosphaerella plurivora]